MHFRVILTWELNKISVFLITHYNAQVNVPSNQPVFPIRDFPDHATFREKSVTLALSDKIRVFLPLTLCNKANIYPL